MRRVLAIMIASSAVVACSGDSDDGDGSAGASTTATTTSTVAEVAETNPTTTSPQSTTTTSPPGTTTTTVASDVPPEDGGTATGALADADVQLTTEDGNIQIGVADVPAGVSETFPIPADFDVQLSSATESDFGFSGVSALTVAELAEFYDTGLTEAGYVITARQDVAGVLAVYTFERGEERGQVAISAAPGGGGSSVLVTIGDGSSRSGDSAGN